MGTIPEHMCSLSRLFMHQTKQLTLAMTKKLNAVYTKNAR